MLTAAGLSYSTGGCQHSANKGNPTGTEQGVVHTHIYEPVARRAPLAPQIYKRLPVPIEGAVADQDMGLMSESQMDAFLRNVKSIASADFTVSLN